MKTRTILFIAVLALGTLSFTFSKVDSTTKTKENVSATLRTEPVGGFVADEIVK